VTTASVESANRALLRRSPEGRAPVETPAGEPREWMLRSNTFIAGPSGVGPGNAVAVTLIRRPYSTPGAEPT
jgi:hypothetical protein